jgi:hypothetical protein
MIFVTTPKSGSHTGFKLMQDYFGAKGGFNHSTQTPANLGDYYKFTFVRNPYDRFCSLYHACVINDKKKFVPRHARKHIINYAQWMVKCTKKRRFPRRKLMAPQWLYHEHSRLDNYIQIEHAQEEFRRAFPDKNIVMPHELRRDHVTWDEVKTPKLIELVNEWAGKDFEFYGYKNENNSS